MGLNELKQKALSLPLSPGVYIMKDRNDTVIYVGKAKKLKNRVSQYFQDTASHTAKTRKMVNQIDHFEIITAASDFEALVLECSLIKQYMPKYNILLKDDKGYPYLRIETKKPYPTISIANKAVDDAAEYFGPFGSRGVTKHILRTVQETLKLPTCNLRFPRDIGKNRPCLNYHINRCSGWCQNFKTQSQYAEAIEHAKQLLSGHYKKTAQQIKENMLEAAEQLNFELAASLRDQLNAVDALGRKQLVSATVNSDTDVIGFAQTETKACFAVLHYYSGALLDKDYEIFASVDEPEYAVSSLIKQYYMNRGYAPKNVLLPFEIGDSALFEELLLQKLNRKVKFSTPKRGDKARLVELAVSNARNEAERVTDKEERTNTTLRLLAQMLGLSSVMRIESFDISNLSSADIVGSMVVFLDGKPRKSEYKRFKIRDLKNQDDYASMQQVLYRRFTNLLQGDKGFTDVPDLLLIDGGAIHATTARRVLNDLSLNIPVFGMVKDDRHRTRSLVTPCGEEIRIDNQQSVFSLIGNIQEETHRFAITYNRQLRSKRVSYSELDKIDGIGTKRKQELIKKFHSISGIKEASLADLERYLPKNVAYSVYAHFHKTKKG